MTTPWRFRIGAAAFGCAAIVLGLVNLICGDFATVWQPIQAFGNVPFRGALAYVSAGALILGGLGVLRRPTARPGAAILLVVYAAFAIMWVPRIIGFPGLFGTWAGCLQQAAPAAAAAIVFLDSTTMRDVERNRKIRLMQIIFGICVLSFAGEHFTALTQTAAMVPSWIPANGRFWAVITGVFFFLAGIALIVKVQDLLAARLLTAMLLCFGALIWLPVLITSVHSQIAWAGNGVNLAVAGAAWIIADAIALKRRSERAGKWSYTL